MIILHVFKNWDEAMRSKWRLSIRHWPNSRKVKQAGGLIHQVIIAESPATKKRQEKVVTCAVISKPISRITGYFPYIEEVILTLAKKDTSIL